MTQDYLPPMIRYAASTQAGLSRHGIDRLVAQGAYERVAPGVFARTGVADDTTVAWMAIALKKPRATLCLMTALALHDLTDEIPRRTDIAVPRGESPIAVEFAPVAWHRFDPETFDLGRGDHRLPDGSSIGLYSAERTIIDSARLRHRLGQDVAIEAIKRWLPCRGSSPGALLRLAESFPKAHPFLASTLEVLL